jgi:hypothetical protein
MKVPKALVGHPATKEHAAIVQFYQADEPEGTWTTIRTSNALPAKEVHAIAERIEKLQRAVKFAREDANRLPVETIHSGDVLLKYRVRFIFLRRPPAVELSGEWSA